MADPFRVEPKGKSWADIVEEDEQSDLLNSQHEEYPSASKEEEANEESDATTLQDAVSATTPDLQADSSKEEQPLKVQDKTVLKGSGASKWASAPSEPRAESKWQSTSSSSKAGSMASKWASAPDSPSPSRSRYDSNRQSRHDSYSRFGDSNGRNTDLTRNNRWREDPPSGGRLNRSAFEDEDTRNGGFSNKANFSREKRYQEYHELTTKGVVKDEAPEHKKAIEGWNAYKPPAEENEETAKQLVKAASEVEQPSADQTAKQEQQDAPIAQKEDSKEVEVSPTKAVEPVKPAISSSPSLKPVSSFSWADDIPDDNSDDDDDYPIPADWMKPKAASPAGTTPVQETSATPPAAENGIKESATDDLSTKFDPGDKADEAKPELSQPTRDTDPINPTSSVATATTLPVEVSPKEEKPAFTWGALDDYKEPAMTQSEGNGSADVTAQNDKAEEEEEKPVQPACNDESITMATLVETTSAPLSSSSSQALKEEAPKEEAPTYTWGALNDYKEPEFTIPKADEVVKIDKEQEEAAVAAWNSVRLPEEPEEEVAAGPANEEKLSTSQFFEEKPSWSQSVEQEKSSWGQSDQEQPSWNQPAVSSWGQANEQQPNSATESQQQPNGTTGSHQQPTPAPEPKPTYTWGALDDYKEPEVIAKPKSDIVNISKQDEEAAISAWNSVKLPEVPELNEGTSPELVNDTPSWNPSATSPESTKAEPAWNVNTQEPEPVKAEPSWNTTFGESSWNADAQAASSWGAVEQPTWSEPSTTAESNTPQQQQQQDWSSNSFQEGSSVTSKSSYKDTWRNKLPTAVDDNVGGWKSFAETVAVPPEPAPKQRVEEPATTATATTATTAATAPRESTFKRTEKGSAASKWKHDRYNGAELIHPRPSQRKPHNLSFKLNDFKDATDNEVHVSWKDIQAQDSPKISIKDDASNRQVTVGLGEFSRANPTQDIVLRLSDITSDRPAKKDINQQKQQQQQPLHQQGPQEVVLSFSELNKGRNGAGDTTSPSANATSINGASSSGPKEIVCKLSDFGRKEKTDGPVDITLKLF